VVGLHWLDGKYFPLTTLSFPQTGPLRDIKIIVAVLSNYIFVYTPITGLIDLKNEKVLFLIEH